MLNTRRLLGGMLAVLLVSGVACKQSSSVQAPAQTVSTDTPEIAALRVTANAGDAHAQWHLGVMYRNGRGVPQDYVEAHKWYNLGASRVSAENQKIFAEARDAVAQLMTPQQLAEAQRLAREWLAAFEKRGGK